MVQLHTFLLIAMVASSRFRSEKDVSSDNVDHVNLDGRLIVPSLVEPHAHLDKSLTADVVPNPKGDLMGAIYGWRDAEAAE